MYEKGGIGVLNKFDLSLELLGASYIIKTKIVNKGLAGNSKDCKQRSGRVVWIVYLKPVPDQLYYVTRKCTQPLTPFPSL